MVVQFPPRVPDPIKDVRVVMATLCNTVVNHDSVQEIGPLLLLNVGLLQDLLNLLNFVLEHVNLILCSALESSEHMLGNLYLLVGNSKLAPCELLGIAELEGLVLDLDRLGQVLPVTLGRAG